MNSPQFFSQSGEDCLLWQLLGSSPDGIFIEVGAFDGIHLSNSYTFENLGWNGICVEPHPEYFALLEKQRPGTICVNCACVADPEIKTVSFKSESAGLLSGIDPLDADSLERRYKLRGKSFEGFNVVEVAGRTLKSILEEHNADNKPIAFLSVDVEGTEIDVLRGMDLSVNRPRVIVAEANSQEHEAELVKLVCDEHGYRYPGSLEVNSFFCRDAEDAKRLLELEVNCELTEVEHPAGFGTGRPPVAETRIGPRNWGRRKRKSWWKQMLGKARGK